MSSQPAVNDLVAELLGGVQIAPSILSADFGRLREQVAEVMQAGARVIHVDVMDGHFVPPITIGPLIVEALREQAESAGAILDVHLMIERPERHVRDFVNAGAHLVTFHPEATPHADYTAQQIRAAGGAVGMAINPSTPVEVLTDMAGEIDMALCMTVNPGWGGQAFITRSPAKIRRLRELIGPDTALQVDGGVDPSTAPDCRRSGANIFVAGSAIFKAPDPGAAFRAIAASLDGVLATV